MKKIYNVDVEYMRDPIFMIGLTLAEVVTENNGEITHYSVICEDIVPNKIYKYNLPALGRPNPNYGNKNLSIYSSQYDEITEIIKEKLNDVIGTDFNISVTLNSSILTIQVE